MNHDIYQQALLNKKLNWQNKQRPSIKWMIAILFFAVIGALWYFIGTSF